MKTILITGTSSGIGLLARWQGSWVRPRKTLHHLHNACPIPYDGSIPEAGGSLMGDKSPKNNAKSQKQKTMKAQSTPKPTTSPVKK